jgi:predicted Fe-S protein YdhL (DUF1289 family)
MSDSISNSSLSTKNQEHIPYTCDVCGAKVVSTNKTTQCLGCGKNLREICNTYNLYAPDFHLLKKKDQKKMKRFGRDIENARKSKTIFTIMPAILGMIGFNIIN